ncbi:MAG: metal-sensing transcriptional repressor [Firmicutes bacterium]|nr:metal-sensing transcriptional repressor [Bacillota bacterium]
MNKSTQRSAELKKKLIIRLNKIEGQIRGLKNMVENDDYCDDILTQISASRAALVGVSKLVLENHLKSCLVRDIKNDQNEIIDELLVTVERMMKG